jgi:hypothetical protein
LKPWDSWLNQSEVWDFRVVDDAYKMDFEKVFYEYPDMDSKDTRRVMKREVFHPYTSEFLEEKHPDDFEDYHYNDDGTVVVVRYPNKDGRAPGSRGCSKYAIVTKYDNEEMLSMDKPFEKTKYEPRFFSNVDGLHNDFKDSFVSGYPLETICYDKNGNLQEKFKYDWMTKSENSDDKDVVVIRGFCKIYDNHDNLCRVDVLDKDGKILSKMNDSRTSTKVEQVSSVFDFLESNSDLSDEKGII